MKKYKLITALALALFLNACKEDEPAQPDNLVQFSAAEVGISEGESNVTLDIQFSRAVSEAVSLEVSIAGSGITYGTDFTTTPAATDGKITWSVPAGSSGTEVIIHKAEGVLLDGDETVVLTFNSIASALVAGEKQQVVVNFAEILSTGAVLDINGGGASYPNKVFIDLSANRQTAVDRNAWDFGFYAGADDFRVTLNSSVGMLARALEKTDLNMVTASDTTGFKSAMAVGFTATHAAVSWIDAPNGQLGQTAIAQISATAEENKVYIINRGSAAKNWKKVRVLRNGDGYTIQYADIAATSFNSINIPKSETHDFVYAHLENGVVSVEPARGRWDIAWTYFINTTGAPGSEIPYGFQDIVLQNRFDVSIAKVTALAYNAFDEGDLEGISFSTDTQLSIGSDWRVTQPSAAVNTDRFYVIKDATGNYYKLRFTAITKDGVRGTPQIEYALVKRGE